MLKKEIIKKLKEYREKERYSQREFAEKIGIHVNTLQKFEVGNVSPQFEVVEKIILGMDMIITIDKNKKGE